MITVRAELHIHTVVSPCAEIEMLPPLIVSEAIDHGLDLIAITDHNSTANIEAVQKAAAGSNLKVLPGMEVQTREEVHVLCLFDTLEQANAWQIEVDANLPRIENRPDYFGQQLVVDEFGDFVRYENQLLLTSTRFTLEEAWRKVSELGGLFIPAHVNRKANGLLSILGMPPAEIRFDALEISRHLKPAQAYREFPQIQGYPLIQNGDVHRLTDMIGVNQFTVEDLNTAELQLALHGLDGRSHRILSRTVTETV